VKGKQMASGKSKMKVLEEQRDALVAEMEALKNKIAGLELAMSLISGDAPLGDKETGTTRVNVKGTLLDLLKQAGTTGLNAQSAVDIAQARGITLERGTISSLLSRFKRDEIVVYDGEKYKLKQFAQAVERPPIPHVSIVQ
jgi:hypothetical protein